MLDTVPRARAWIVFLVASLGCRASAGVVGEAAPIRSDPERAAPIELPATVIHEATLAGNEVLLVGQQRASEVGSRAWVALADLDGRPRWTATLDGPFSWAETARIDPQGTIHVFGHRAGGTSWLWRFDAEGREVALDTLPHAELLGFELSATQVQLLVGRRGVAPGELAAAWLGFDWATGTSSIHAWEWFFDSFDDPPEFATLEPGEFEFNGDVYRLPTASVRHLDSLDEPEAEHARAQAQPPVSALVAVDVPIGEPVSLDLGESELWIAQLPPQAGIDARALLVRADKLPSASRDQLRAWLEAVSAALRQLNVDPNDPWAWVWSWPFVEQLPPLDVGQQASLGAWMLDAADCEAVNRGLDCHQQDVVYPIPNTYDPTDPCWMLGEIEDVIAATGREGAGKNFDEWLALLEAGYVEGRSLGVEGEVFIEWTPREMIIDRFVEIGLGARLIGAMVLDFDGGTPAASDAIANLANLPVDTAIPLALELVDALRDEPSRCEDVHALVDFIESRGVAAPVWSADLSSDCDVYYVLCTGLQPELEELVTGPRGFEIVEACADERPQDAQLAEDWGLDVCTPTSTREAYFSHDLEPEVSAEIAAACGTSAALAELRYTCGVMIEFEVYRYESSLGSDGRVRIDKLEILHTTAE